MPTGLAISGRHRFLRPGLAGAICAILVLAAGWLGTRPAVAAPSVTCQEYSASGGNAIQVALAPGQPATYRLYGELCATPGELQQGATVQLLIHGATNDHRYFDFPYQPATYSYARNLAAQGYPTFDIDRIGDGQSDHPSSSQIDFQVHAFVAHQVIQGLKGLAGGAAIPGIPRFGKVIEVGHSIGSMVTWFEASTYGDVDGVIITGLLHHVSSVGQGELSTSLYPANQDPCCSGMGLDAGYLTTRPGTRGSDFYNTAYADPNVIQTDENTKQTMVSNEASQASTGLNPSLTQQIHVPVLVLVGQSDKLFCDATFDCGSSQAVQKAEAPDYGSGSCLQAQSIPQSGHNINLHYTQQYPSTLLEQSTAWKWSNQFIGQPVLGVKPSGCPAP